MKVLSASSHWFWKFSVVVYLDKGKVHNRTPEEGLVCEIQKIWDQLGKVIMSLKDNLNFDLGCLCPLLNSCEAKAGKIKQL